MRKFSVLSLEALALIALSVAGFGAGVVSAALVLNPALGLGDMLMIGHWYTPKDVGSPGASPWTRAFIAYHGTFGLQSSEVIYLTRRRDDEGQPFRENCDYEISGAGLPAHWWSLTIYDADGYLPRNSGNNSLNASQVQGKTSWAVSVSPGNDEGSLSSLSAGDFDVMVRLYVPSKKPEELKEEELPGVRRIRCHG